MLAFFSRPHVPEPGRRAYPPEPGQPGHPGRPTAPPRAGGGPKGQFTQDPDGSRYAGVHVLVDLWQVSGAGDPAYVRGTIEQAIASCGATLLELRLHQFDPAGITAVAVLSESHLSFHSWPQEDFVAVDIFTCGDLDPRRAVSVLRERLAPGRVAITTHRRGLQPLAAEEDR
jgi:S-adenosylmethionine decarboxylase